MTDQETIEAVAKEMWESCSGGEGVGWNNAFPWEQSRFHRYAVAAISRLRALGWRDPEKQDNTPP